MLADLLEEVVRDGEAAVDRTPEQLEVLRESGVVDAGAYGLVVIFAGDRRRAARRRRGPAGRRTTCRRETRGPTTRTAATATAPTSSSPGTGWRGSAFVPRLEELGDSVLVVGDEATIKVHVHTDEPDPRWACSTARARCRSSTSPTCASRWPSAQRGCRPAAARSSRWRRATASGASTRSSAPSSLTAGRPSIPPSTTCWPRSTRSRPRRSWCCRTTRTCVMAAERAAELSDKQATVVRCTSQQGGLVAMVEMDSALSGEENAERLGAVAGTRAHRLGRARRPRRRAEPVRRRGRRRLRRRARSSPGAGPSRRCARRWPQLADGRRDRHGRLRRRRADPAGRDRAATRPTGWRLSSTTAASRTTGGCWPLSDTPTGGRRCIGTPA